MFRQLFRIPSYMWWTVGMITITQLLIFAGVGLLINSHGGNMWDLAIDKESNEYMILAYSIIAENRYVLAGDIAETFRTPGYPIALALLLIVFQGAFLPIIFFHSLLIGISGAVIVYIAEKLSMSRLVAFVMAGAYALSVGTIYMTIAGLGSEIIYSTMHIAATALLINLTLGTGTPLRTASCIALCLGIATFARPVGILGSIPLLAGLVLLPPTAQFPNILSRARIGGLSVLIFLILLLPWCYRNYTVTGEFLFSTLPTFNFTFYNIPFFLSYWDNAPESITREKMLSEIGNPHMDQLRNAPYADELSQVSHDFLRSNALPYSFFHAIKMIPFFVGSSLHSLHNVVSAQAPALRLPYFPTEEYNLTSEILRGNWIQVASILREFWLVTLERIIWIMTFGFAFIAPFFSTGIRRKLFILFTLVIMWSAFLTSPVAQPRYRIAAEPFIMLSAGFTMYTLWNWRYKKDIVQIT